MSFSGKEVDEFQDAIKLYKDDQTDYMFGEVIGMLGDMPDREKYRSSDVNRGSFRVAARFDELMKDLNGENTSENEGKRQVTGRANENPFMYYGIGVHNFVKMNTRLVCIFFALAILAIVQMVIFRSYSGLDSFSSINPTANWSFGSMGYPKNLCSKNYIDWSQESINL